jgi:hypothetical protein
MGSHPIDNVVMKVLTNAAQKLIHTRAPFAFVKDRGLESDSSHGTHHGIIKNTSTSRGQSLAKGGNFCGSGDKLRGNNVGLKVQKNGLR